MKFPIISIIVGLLLLDLVFAGFSSVTVIDATSDCDQADVIDDMADGTDGSNYCEFIHDYEASSETVSYTHLTLPTTPYV